METVEGLLRTGGVTESFFSLKKKTALFLLHRDGSLRDSFLVSNRVTLRCSDDTLFPVPLTFVAGYSVVNLFADILELLVKTVNPLLVCVCIIPDSCLQYFPNARPLNELPIFVTTTGGIFLTSKSG